jgi:tetratricopeptide (TPR) repeat protein
VFDINSDNPEEITRELQKMLHDSKNRDYHDQIYFALGNIAMKEGREAEAIEFYRKSATATSQNQNQKGRSYLALASHFFNKPDYIKAGTYYDSAAYFLDQKYPDYLAIKTRSTNLNALTFQLGIIQYEDSLQKVAAMSEGQRNTLISTLIAQVVKEEAEGKNTGQDQYNLGQYYENERRFQGNIEQEGKWYFYNMTALTFGRTEFRRRWGDRKLEDNWRRANRTRVNFSTAGNPNEPDKENADTVAAEKDTKNPAYYLKNLPLNDSLIGLSNGLIENAMLNAGKVYAERIPDPGKATEILETLIGRFPSGELAPEALYTLYNINKVDNKTKSEQFRQKLLQQYPEDEFARILSDPEYYEKKVAESKLAEKTYNQAYTAYTEENFNDAILISQEGLRMYPENALAPKFSLLHAYSTGRISDERTFKEELSELTKKWPGTTESNRASEIIAYLNQKMPELKIEEDIKIATEIYVADTTSKHVFLLVITDPAFNMNQASFDVISYNIDNYTNKNFKTEANLVDNKFIQIVVSGFPDFTQAMNYYLAFKPESLVRNTTGARMMTFIISADNLDAFSVDKNPDRYLLFFKDNYLK